MKHLIEFDKLKVGHTVWIKSEIESVSNGGDYPIRANGQSFTTDGKLVLTHKHPSLFLSIPFESEERVVEVRQSQSEKWIRRVFVKQFERLFICWERAETIEDAKKQYNTVSWRYMREIQPTLELTLEEIAAQYGVDSVKIIDK